MDEKLQLEVHLQKLLATEPAEELFSYMEQKVSDFFSTPDIPKFYRILKPVDFSTCQRSIPKLMIAWMAFLSGDNAYLFPMLENLHEDEFQAPYESSLFYTLKAMVDYMTNTKEGLRYAKIALDILPDYLEKGEKEAVNYLKEVVRIYKEYGGSACFYALPLRTMGLLSKFEPQLFKVLDKRLKSTRITPVTPADAILSSREREIMKLISHGKSNEEISKTLYIGIGTIKWHINHIFSKLEVKNRIQAVEKARSLGVI